MSKIWCFLLTVCLCAPFVKIQASQDVKKVAIIDVVDREGSIAYGMKLVLRSSLSEAVTNTAGYEGYDRVDISSIMDEQHFQQTGLVNDAEIRKIGEMTGASYILVAEMAKIDDFKLIITAKILDVETAKLENTAHVQTGSATNQLREACQQLTQALLGFKKQAGNTDNSRMSDTRGQIDWNPEKGKVVLYCEGTKLVPPRHLPIIVSIDGRKLGEGSVGEGFYFELSNIQEGEHKLKFEVKNTIAMGLGDKSSTIVISPEYARFYEFGMKKTMLRATEFFSVILKNSK